jgi:DNA-binding NarL/FixJ family response regulator
VRLVLAEIHLDDALIAVAFLAAALSMCVLVRKRFARQSPVHHPTVERDIQQLLTELAQMASNITHELDARTATLKTLLKEADEKIAVLRATSNSRSQVGTERSAVPDPAPPDPVISSSSAPDPRYIDVYTLADQGQSSQQIAQHLGRPSGEVELILALRSPSRE